MKTLNIMQLKPINRRGMTIVELFIYALVASLMLGFFVFLFSRTRKANEQQVLEMDCQRAFTSLCQRVEKDLAGCKKWKIQATAGENTMSSLFIERIKEQITYDANLEKGFVTRKTNKGLTKFSFKGRRTVILKTLSFSKVSDAEDTINLKIRLKGVPPIELSHNFIAYVRSDTVKGFFKKKELNEQK